MKILFLCKRYYTNKDLLADQFGRLFHLPVQLSQLGETVSVLALDYRNASPESAQLYGVSFQTLPVSVTKLPSVLASVRQTVRSLRPDIIVASGDSHIGFAGRILSAQVGAKFVFDVYDYYPAFAGNRLPGMRTMFWSAVREADLVLCASLPLIERLSPVINNVVLIENGVDRNVFRAMDKYAAREAVGIAKSAPWVGYFGAVTPKQGPLLFDAVRHLRSEISNLNVLLAGKLVDCNVTDDFIDYRGELPQAQLPALISACDVVSVPYESDPQIDLSGACKIAEYLACEIPVVATRVAGHEAIFVDAPSSLCEPDPVDFARALQRQLRDPQIVPFPDRLNWSNIGAATCQALEAI